MGNIRALCLCLSGILNAVVRPRRIQVRLEGVYPGINDFYLEQLTDLALLHGVEILLEIHRSTGVRDSRDWHLNNCRTDFLWMMDDDVVPDYRCLAAYNNYYLKLRDENLWTKDVAFLAGSKCDVNNRRKYPVFNMTVQGAAAVTPEANHSLIYHVGECWETCAKTKALDTGNALLYLPLLKEKACSFRQFADHGNSSGDATAFWLQLDKKGLYGFFAPSAVAYHLEKQGGGFNEFEARREMLLRLCDLQKFDKETLKQFWMPGTWT